MHGLACGPSDILAFLAFCPDKDLVFLTIFLFFLFFEFSPFFISGLGQKKDVSRNTHAKKL